MVPLALALTQSTAPADPPVAPVSTLDEALLQRTRQRIKLSRGLLIAAGGGAAVTGLGVALLREDGCGAYANFGPCFAGALMVGVGGLAGGIALTSFLVFAPLTESAGLEAGLSIRPRFGPAPSAIALGGIALLAASPIVFRGNAAVPTLVGGVATTVGLGLAIVQLRRTARAHHRRLTLVPSLNGATLAIRW